MAQPRTEILEWAGQGRIAGAHVRRALELGDALPTNEGWRRFLDRMLLFMAVVLLAAALVFFLAYNWTDLGRFAKFALAEAPIIVALALAWRIGIDGLAGKALLLAVALLTGALLALVGQVYQTGADTFELFTAWALAILPWVALARFAALWLVWLLLLNLAAVFYFRVMPGVWGWIFLPENQLWALFALDTVALAAWEGAATRLAWLRERWAIRLVATASGGCITVLAVMGVFEWRASYGNLAAWAAWMAAAYYFYRHRSRDLYVLAAGALSAIVVATAFLGKNLQFNDAGAFLFIGLAVIGLSAAAGYWLRNIAVEADA